MIFVTPFFTLFTEVSDDLLHQLVGFQKILGKRTHGHLSRRRYGEKESERFSSSFISGAQRLTNGNTLICSGADGRLFEVTAQKEIVWEYINPFFDEGITPAGRRGPNRRQGGGPRGDGPPGRDRGQGGPGGRRGGGRPGGGGGGAPNIVFRALRIAPDHPGLARLAKEGDE